MKKLVALLILTIGFLSVKSQNVSYNGGVHSIETDSLVYIAVSYTKKKQGFIAKVDHGKDENESEVVDENNQVLYFKSKMDIVNFIHTYGWQLKQVVSETVSNSAAGMGSSVGYYSDKYIFERIRKTE